MKICVFGAGAVGGYLAHHLVRSGAEVAVVARGEHLRAIQRNGLRLLTADSDTTLQPAAATDSPATLAPQDLVFVTVKATAQPACARDVAALLAPGGCAVFVGNGIPWWWSHGHTDAGPLPLLDPGGQLWSTLGPQRVLGCVVYSANEQIAPGVIRHFGNNRWLLGEPDGSRSQRLDQAVALLQAAGLAAAPSQDLRREVWIKLLRNAPLNSICALTRLPVDGLATQAGLPQLVDQVIAEVVRIAAACGWDISGYVAQASQAPHAGGGLGGGTQVAGMKPSMLQDVLTGRPLEIDAILGQVQAFARDHGVSCPVIDLLLPLVRGLDQALRHSP